MQRRGQKQRQQQKFKIVESYSQFSADSDQTNIAAMEESFKDVSIE